MKFTKSHEWIDLDEDIGTIGITNFAQNELGEVIYVELPKVGFEVEAGEEVCVLESTKAASDVYTPVSGTIIDVNENLLKNADIVNQSAEEKGWLFKIQLNNPKEYQNLLSFEEYKKLFL